MTEIVEILKKLEEGVFVIMMWSCVCGISLGLIAITLGGIRQELKKLNSDR